MLKIFTLLECAFDDVTIRHDGIIQIGIATEIAFTGKVYSVVDVLSGDVTHCHTAQDAVSTAKKIDALYFKC
jgi:hypothetical protein